MGHWGVLDSGLLVLGCWPRPESILPRAARTKRMPGTKNRFTRQNRRTASVFRHASLYWLRILCRGRQQAKHSPCPLITTTGRERKPGVQVRLAAGSPMAPNSSHLNPGFKVVSQASSWRRMYFSVGAGPARDTFPRKCAGASRARPAPTCPCLRIPHMKQRCGSIHDH